MGCVISDSTYTSGCSHSSLKITVVNVFKEMMTEIMFSYFSPSLSLISFNYCWDHGRFGCMKAVHLFNENTLVFVVYDLFH